MGGLDEWTFWAGLLSGCIEKAGVLRGGVLRGGCTEGGGGVDYTLGICHRIESRDHGP